MKRLLERWYTFHRNLIKGKERDISLIYAGIFVGGAFALIDWGTLPLSIFYPWFLFGYYLMIGLILPHWILSFIKRREDPNKLPDREAVIKHLEAKGIKPGARLRCAHWDMEFTFNDWDDVKFSQLSVTGPDDKYWLVSTKDTLVNHGISFAWLMRYVNCPSEGSEGYAQVIKD